MKRILIIWSLACGLSSLSLGQTKGRPVDQNKVGSYSPDEQEIMTLENELIKAGLRGDAGAADRLLAEGYCFMTRDGAVHENLKAALLASMKSGESKADLLVRMKSSKNGEPTLRPATIDDAQVHVYGDTGVVMMRSTYKRRGKDGRVVEAPTRFMHVWVRQQGRWQLVAGSSTRIGRPE